ncbi:hypothetical protein RESH_02701 [Rhodopirellula europaea SH398]|uniref:Uncharacterized protein n=1 Tax=Rhodopirellula europaea SH398 TaxID=1263868 RepID=M5S5B5_9BACT|nr:hypothetical protein RESH_02701 [Rhodopirellula europaea SH398]
MSWFVACSMCVMNSIGQLLREFIEVSSIPELPRKLHPTRIKR